MQHHNFDVDITIPYSKQKVKINKDFIEVNTTTIACTDVEAVKYGVSLIGSVKKPQKKRYSIDVKSKAGKSINIQFDSNKVGELLEEDHTYYYIMSGLWQYVKKHLVEDFIEKLNEQQAIVVGNAKFNYQGFTMSYKTWFWGKTKAELVPWNELEFQVDKGVLKISSVTDKRKKVGVSFHNDWNAVVLNTLLHYLWQENRKVKLQNGEKL